MKLHLLHGVITIIDDEDHERIESYNWHKSSLGYVVANGRTNPPTKLRLHRVIMNAPKGMYVDHINGNKLDNRKSNLRLCTNQQNQFNAKIAKNNKSGVKGVFRELDKRNGKYHWRASMKLNGKDISLGNHKYKKDAVKARMDAVKNYHGDFAYGKSTSRRN